MSNGYQSPSTFHLRRRTPGTFVLVPDPQQGRSIRCQGQLEAAAVQILVACPLVARVEEQPLAIWYVWNEASDEPSLLDAPSTKALRKERRCSYIVPDFLATMQCGTKHLIEIKPSEKLARLDARRKLSVGRLYAERQGWTFHFVTERELFAGPLLANLRLVHRFRYAAVAADLLAQIEGLIQGPILLGNLRNAFASTARAEVRAAALHLVAAGRIDLDPTAAAISPTTLLSPKGTIPWDPFVSAWGPSGSGMSGDSGSYVNSIPTSSSPKT